MIQFPFSLSFLSQFFRWTYDIVTSVLFSFFKLKYRMAYAHHKHAIETFVSVHSFETFRLQLCTTQDHNIFFAHHIIHAGSNTG